MLCCFAQTPGSHPLGRDPGGTIIAFDGPALLPNHRIRCAVPPDGRRRESSNGVNPRRSFTSEARRANEDRALLHGFEAPAQCKRPRHLSLTYTPSSRAYPISLMSK